MGVEGVKRMQIEREIRKKINEHNGIAVFQNKSLVIELTDLEMEEAYCIKEAEYLRIDILIELAEFCEYEDVQGELASRIMQNGEIINQIAERYKKRRSRNVAQNDTMNEAIREVLKEARIWK